MSQAPDSSDGGAFRSGAFSGFVARQRRFDLARKLVTWSIGRSLVFLGTGGLILFVFAQRTAGLRLTFSLQLTVAVVLVAQVTAFLSWWVAKRRLHMEGLSLAFMVLDQLLVGALAYVTGGVASGATSLFGVTCVVGGLLLGAQGASVATLSGCVVFSLIMLVHQGSQNLLPPDQSADVYSLTSGQAAYYYVFTIFMLILVGLLSGYLAERLQRAGGELEDAHRRAAQAERMAVLGRLAAGLAHEIRNPLGSISGAVQMLRSGAEREEDRDLCDIVIRESGRLNELVSDMVDLSRQREPHLELTDLGRVVDDVVELSKQSGRAVQDVEIRREGVKAVSVLCDSGQIRQLVWNLIRNAVQASAAGGEVRVRLESAESVRLFVEDDGTGMDSRAAARIFDAFYTTRSQGTGLGLAVVKRIADEHEFQLEVKSEHGEGAEFIVDFGPSAPDMAS